MPFISVAGSSFVEMLVGVGAARVRDLFEEARQRAPAIIFIDELDSVGRKRGSAAVGALILTEDEKERIAVHEASHALTAALQPEADPVSKVTIMPTRKALGNTQQLPLEDQRLHAESYLDAKLTVLLGGRAAEHVVFGEGSTGGAEDLRGATALAMKVVSEFGLSPRMGPVGWAAQNGEYVPVPLRQRPYAEATGELIDDEVRRLVGEVEDNATRMLEAHREELDELVSRLLEEETVDGDAVYRLVGHQVPQRSE